MDRRCHLAHPEWTAAGGRQHVDAPLLRAHGSEKLFLNGSALYALASQMALYHLGPQPTHYTPTLFHLLRDVCPSVGNADVENPAADPTSHFSHFRGTIVIGSLGRGGVIGPGGLLVRLFQSYHVERF